MHPPLDILCEDGPVLAVNKPAGVVTQGAPAGEMSLADQVKEYLKRKYDKPGNVYLGIAHRLDRPVSGVVVFSRNSKCAARLSEQFRERQVRKVYQAIVERPPPAESGTLTDWLLRDRAAGEVRVVPAHSPGAREAALEFHTRARRGGRAWLQLEPTTGRMHQIRVQLASRGLPVLGDVKYGARARLAPATAGPVAMALHASSLMLRHPIRYDELTIVAPVPPNWRGLGFDDLIA